VTVNGTAIRARDKAWPPTAMMDVSALVANGTLRMAATFSAVSLLSLTPRVTTCALSVCCAR
jgi:hypothetical protein